MISIITCTNRPTYMNNVFANYARQEFNEKELIIVLNRDDMDLQEWKLKAQKFQNVSVYKLPQSKTLGECLNFGVSKMKYNYMAKFDDDDYYAPFYISETINAFKNTNADLIGKAQYYAYVEKYKSFVHRNGGPENKYVRSLRGPTLAVKKHVFRNVQWPKASVAADKIFQKMCLDKGYRFYSTSKYHFAYRKRSSGDHTWGISEETFLKKCTFICYTEDYKKMVDPPLSKKVTAIIKTFERSHCVDRLIRSIRRYYPDLPIIVADDSKNPTVRNDVEFHALPVDSGVSAGRNFLAKQVKTPYTLVLDDDFYLIKESKIEKMLQVLESSDIDIVGGRFLEKKGVRGSQGTFGLKDGNLHYQVKSRGQKSGAELYDIINIFFLAKTSTLLRYKWDERLKTGGQHLDFFWTHKGKIKVAMHPEIFVYHYHDRTSRTYNQYRKRDSQVFKPMFMKKHGIKKIVYEQNIFRPLSTVKKFLSPETLTMISNTKWGKYEVDPVSTEKGKQGSLFKGYDPSKKKAVAIKRMENIAASRHEAAVMKACGTHRHLSQYYDFFVLNNKAHLVAEWMKGRSLRTKPKKYDEKTAVRITLNLLDGLQHVHKKGFLHGDILPNNIMITEGKPDTVKLIDFGIAVQKGKDGCYRKKHYRKKDSVLCPPEQRSGEWWVLDDSSDLYRMAGICVFLMTGKTPALDHATRAHKCSLPNKKLEAVLNKAMAPNKEKRYRRAAELISALKPFA